MPRRWWTENLEILKITSVEDLRLDHEGWQLSFCHWGRENWVLYHWVEFSTVAATVKFFGSRPAKMNWDLKHHVMCWTLGVLLDFLELSFSSCGRTEVKKLIKPFVPEQRSPPVLCIWICIVYVFVVPLLLRLLWLYNNDKSLQISGTLSFF